MNLTPNHCVDPAVEQAWCRLNDSITTCRACPRLTNWREEVAAIKRRAYRDQEYWGKPVTGFGDPQARLVVIGLAPGAHGSNRTGRMFTGDGSGDFLFPALYRAGFASQPQSIGQDDGMTLSDLFITAVGRCAPPDNKPLPAELAKCEPFLLSELDLLTNMQGVVVLGNIAFERTLRILGRNGTPASRPRFGHGAVVEIKNGPWVLASYHPSRQNTQTGRLTAAMFDDIWQTARQRLSG